MKRSLRLWVVALGVIVLAPVGVFLGVAFFAAQRADYGWSPSVAHPAYTVEHPRVLFDESHDNASTAGFAGRYWAFGRLVRADGFTLVRGHRPFTSAYLRQGRILVVANASGAPRLQLFGMNLPVHADGNRSDPAFSGPEIAEVRAWVAQGGSLLLIADHAPFGEAASALASAFGVTMHKGFVEVPGESSDPLLFATSNGRLGHHPIIDGGTRGPAVSRVMTYTGQSLDAPPGATVLLRLPDSAVESVPVGDALVDRPAGRAQGVALEFGRGRVVVLGEAAMATAQVSRRIPFGINAPGNDNQQFVLNILHWLDHRL